MRSSNSILTLVMLAFGACVLQAAPVDPQGVFDTEIAGLGVTDVDPFNIQVDSSGGGAFNFRNVSGNDWIGIDWFVTLPADDSITCKGGPYFDACDFTSTPIPGTSLAMFDISFDQPINGGIQPLAIFSINLNDPLDTGGPNTSPTGAGGWVPNSTIMVVETDAVPEPASLWLLGGGIALLASVRRLRLRPQHKL